MKLLSIFIFFICFALNAAGKDSTTYYHLPDSVKAVSFIADISFRSHGKKEVYAGLGVKHIKLLMEKDKDEAEISFEFPSSAQVIAKGMDVEVEKDEIEWKFNWQLQSTYKLMIVSSVDSAGNFSIYSGYIFLPDHQKWKLLGTCKINDERTTIKDPVTLQSSGKKTNADVSFSNVMVQRNAGSWKRLDHVNQAMTPPPVPPLVNIDSVQQMMEDKKLIEAAISLGTTQTHQNIDGVYYFIADPGNGKSFSINDSVTVRYQLRIFGTTEMISGSETETYTFPLKNLIKAWQLALPLVKTGGKIKMVIPSGLAYSIRTRAPKIPPNSILEFDVEVLDAKTTNN